MFITIFLDSIINMISDIIIIMDRAIKIVVTIISSLLDYSLSMMAKFKVVTDFIKEINYFEVILIINFNFLLLIKLKLNFYSLIIKIIIIIIMMTIKLKFNFTF